MKFWKRSLSLLLTLCMLLNILPGSLFAVETRAETKAADEFYKIVHLDAGRKYYSPEVIKQYLDLMASNGFNQLELYMSDNQGFRFALNDMKITTTYGTYDLSKSLGNGYDQDYKSSHLNWYRPSLEPDGENYLTQDEMTDLISYARKRGIEIVPCINMPGHMGAILEEFPQFRYKTSQSSLDLENAEANAFALALLEKYVSYFESQGCKYYSIGGDEYAYDIGNDISICNSATYTDYIVPFMNRCAEIIIEHDMTPRAFNDFFGWNKDAMVSKDFQICYWADIANGGGLKHISDLIAMGYDKFINTNENWYFALGSAYYTLDSTSAGVNSADPYVFCSKNGHPETYENGLGAMFCIWSDRGRLDNATCNTDTDADGRTTHTNYSSIQEPVGGDGGKTVFELTKPYIEIMGTKLPKTPIVFRLDQGESYVLGRFEGKQTAAAWAETLGLTGNTVLDVTAEHVQTAIPNEIAAQPLSSFTNGDLVVVSDGTYYLTLQGTELGATTDPEKATIWTSDGKLLRANGLYLVGDPTYNGRDDLVATDKPDGCGWKINNGSMQGSNYGNKYITLGSGGAGASSTASGVGAYKVVPGIPDLTEVAVVGKAEGTAVFMYNDVEYTIIVGNAVIPVCPHDNVIHHERVEPTMDEYGYEEYWECRDCGKLFKDADCTLKTTLLALRIDKLPSPDHVHLLTHHPVKPATTTETGVKREYWECTGENYGKTRVLMEEGCGEFFDDAKATVEISAADLEAHYIEPMLVEAEGEHIVNVNIGASHTCDKCVVTSVGKELSFEEGQNYDPNGIASYTVKVASKTETVGGGSGAAAGELITGEMLGALAVGGTIECVLGNGATFMKADGSVCAQADADIWTITKDSSDTYTIKNAAGQYIGDGSSWAPVSIGDSAGKWKYDGTQFLNVATYYNGLGLRDGVWQVVYNTAGNNPTPLLPYAVASAGGSEGEEVTTYTYTFTFNGVAAGSADLVAGDMTFHVNVKDPSACEHTGGVATCQHGKICEKCGATYTDPDPDFHEHFTPANCVEKAHCTDCDKDFGEVDPSNHKGPTETRYPNGFNSTNHTGDVYCTACDMLIKQGKPIDPNYEIIHMFEDEELEFFVPCGDQPLNLDTTSMDQSVIASVNADFQAFVAGNPKKQVTDVSALPNDTEMIVTNGTLYLMATEQEDGTFALTVTDKEDEATKFMMYKSGKSTDKDSDPDGRALPTFELRYKGQALRAVNEDYGKDLAMAASDFGKNNWVIDSSGTLRTQYYPQAHIVLDEGTPRLAGDKTTITNVAAYIPNTDTPSGMNVKITAGAEGQTSFKLGQNTYTVIVEPVILEGQQVTVDYFITNEWTGYTGSTAPEVHTKDIKASDRWVNTPDGVTLESMVPENIKHRGFDTVYWKGTKHPEDHMQYDMNHTNGNGSLDVTKAKDAVDFKYIRFWGGHWAVSWDGKTWVKLNNGDQLVARYLLKTDVTEEVITEVQDWGETAYSNTYRVLLDFAVKYSSGDVRPDPNAYFIDGKSIFYHAIPGQDKVEDVNGVAYRRIDTIIGQETSEREVYMITLTPTNDDYTKRLEDSQMGAGGKYTYDGTEQIVWLENAQTEFPTDLVFHPDFRWGETPGTALSDDERFAGKSPVEGQEWNEFPNTEGEPYVDRVKIYDHQGMLVTYYLRAKEDTEKDKLNVHYLEYFGTTEDGAINANEFYNYGIVVNPGTVFDPEFGMDSQSETGLTHNTVVNDLGYEQTVTADLKKMANIPAKYRTGEYELMLVQGGKDGKDVYIYYVKKGLERYIVADFGLPMEITWENVLQDDNLKDFSFVGMSWSETGTDADNNPYEDRLVFGEILEGEKTGDVVKSYIYKPNKIFTDLEKPIHLNVTMDGPVEGEDGKPEEQRIIKTFVVHIVPATTVYYEPDFIQFDEKWVLTGNSSDLKQAAYAVAKEKYPYGYDPVYEKEIAPSGKTYLKPGASGVVAEMAFTGTGIELYANCTPDTGRLMMILKKDGSPVRVVTVDTHIGSGTTSGTDVGALKNSYNTPIISLNGLEFGEYTAQLCYYTNTGDMRADAIQLDGFRVTRPVNDSLSKVVYVQNKEAKPIFEEVRDNVLAQVTLPEGWEKDSEYAEQLNKDIWNQVHANAGTNGKISAVVVGEDSTGISSDAEVNFDIADNGPKNEFYLQPGMTLLMSVSASYNYQIGMKALDGETSFEDVSNAVSVTSSTDMYYRVTANTEGTLLTVKNTGSKILVITKLKCLPKNQVVAEPAAPEAVSVAFTEESLAAALMSLEKDVLPELTVVLTPNVSSAGTGKLVKFTAEAAGGAGGYTYEFVTRDAGKEMHINSSGDICRYKTVSTGKKEFEVTVTDADGNMAKASCLITVE